MDCVDRDEQEMEVALNFLVPVPLYLAELQLNKFNSQREWPRLACVCLGLFKFGFKFGDFGAPEPGTCCPAAAQQLELPRTACELPRTTCEQMPLVIA